MLRAVCGAILCAILLAAGVIVAKTALENDLPLAPRVADPEGTELRHLSADDEDRVRRIAMKHEAIADLFDDRLSPEAALERFWDLTATCPESLNNLRSGVAGSSDEERVANQLVSFARTHAEREPAKHSNRMRLVEATVQSLAARKSLPR